ncbi:MAG: hypothetical protein D6723_12270 [Acidobacteria bacterium]|nr:MAG: hypothetical protein D6723_12270 [Acidobacteriota bacterium]
MSAIGPEDVMLETTVTERHPGAMNESETSPMGGGRLAASATDDGRVVVMDSRPRGPLLESEWTWK